MLDPPPSLSSFTQPAPHRSRRASQLFHSALASSLEASVSALSLSPRLVARGERLSSFTQPSPRRSRRASQLFHSALASSLEASVSARTATLPPVGRREVERTLLLERGCGYQTAME